ncbi:MAG: hypothetical protein MUF00_05730 [Gemmatimonadaceae bacterium]|jgi:hypothetical protein|nr:hypothetical protein [Gemmatimonadaceae bacterium]
MRPIVPRIALLFMTTMAAHAQSPVPTAPPPGHYLCYDLRLGLGVGAPRAIVQTVVPSASAQSGMQVTPTPTTRLRYGWHFMEVLELLDGSRYRVPDGEGRYGYDDRTRRILFETGPYASSRPLGEYRGLGESASTRDRTVSRPRLDDQAAEAPYLITYRTGEEDGRGDNNWHCSP